jgi:putative transposase
MVQQARNMLMRWSEKGSLPKYLILDMDSKFTAKLRATLEADGIATLRMGPKKPNLNPHAEKFVPSIKRECLDDFVCFGVNPTCSKMQRKETLLVVDPIG